MNKYKNAAKELRRAKDVILRLLDPPLLSIDTHETTDGWVYYCSIIGFVDNLFLYITLSQLAIEDEPEIKFAPMLKKEVIDIALSELQKAKIKYLPSCQHCKFIDKVFTPTLKKKDSTNREYWLMTETFLYLHGSDVCNFIPQTK